MGFYNFILEALKLLKNPLSSQKYIYFLVIGFAMVYFKGDAKEVDNVVKYAGYTIIVFGVLFAAITKIISVRIEMYENIIKQYTALSSSIKKSLDSREKLVQNNYNTSKDENTENINEPINENIETKV